MRFSRLNALRTFEAAARLGGFAAAACELNVTPAAVSHQIKSLEEDLKTKLFHRHARGIEITASGRELLPEVKQGLAHFERGIGNLRAGGMSGRLVANVAPSIGARWLIPLLGEFMSDHPEVELHILASETPPDLFLGQVDIRIVHGQGHFQNLNSRLFMRDIVTPVCAPALLEQSPISRFEDLRNHTLLHDIDADDPEPSMSWERWLNDANMGLQDVKRHISFGNSTLMVLAAVAGYGIALGRSALVEELVKAGRLVCPLSIERPAERAYYTVTTEASASRVRVETFREWIHMKAHAMRMGGTIDPLEV